MKKEYEIITIEIIELPEDDVIQTSSQILSFDKFSLFENDPNDNWFS